MGWFTDWRPTRSAAADALVGEHERSPLVCSTCRQNRPEVDHYGAPRHLSVVVDPVSERARLECADGHQVQAGAVVTTGSDLCLV